MTVESHDPATCPAFGGCNDCRSAKFEATSPDVAIPTWTRPAELEAEDTWTQLEPWEPRADPVDYAGVPAFNAAADAALARAGSTHTQRGAEYGDTWAIQSQHTPFLDDALLAAAVGELGRADKRLILVAALCDVKLSRMGGGWKEDTCLDLLNYISAYTSWRGDV